MQQVLGVLDPGSSIPLPHNWHQHSKQLQVRPVLPPPAPHHQQLTAFEAAYHLESVSPSLTAADAAPGSGSGNPDAPEPPQQQQPAAATTEGGEGSAIAAPAAAPQLPPGADPDNAPSHSWSFGASAGQHSVLLSGLEDGGTRLLCCKTLAVAGEEDEGLTPTTAGLSVGSPRRAARRAPSCWVSACTESTQLFTSSGLDSMNDW